MAQRAVEGKDVLLMAKMGSEYVPFACATSIEFTYERELITKTTVSSGSFREYAYRLGEWGFSLGSVTHISPASTMHTVFDMLQKMKDGSSLDIQLSFTDSLGNSKGITGKVLIPSVSITGPADGFSEDSMEFKGSGAFVITTEIISPPSNTGAVQKQEYEATGGETAIVISVLVGKSILYVGRDGTGKDVIEVGDPTDKQVKFISGTGTLQFPYALGAGEWILVLYN